MKKPVIEIKNLSIGYFSARKTVVAVNDVSLNVYNNELLGLVGESGCGKTTLAMGILKMLSHPGKIMGGEVLITEDDLDLVKVSDKEMKAFRWSKISLIPQGAMNSLNPIMKIGEQMREIILAHEEAKDKKKLQARVDDLLISVGLSPDVCKMYPHELSGGMKQRVCIAMAIALNPRIIFADEPTSALDVVVQKLIAQTILNIKNNMGASIIMIGHDMALMAQMADRIAVMYAGTIVETGPADDIINNAVHPYTKMLMNAVPSIKQKKKFKNVSKDLRFDNSQESKGCIYKYNCPFVEEKCRESKPELVQYSGEHFINCHKIGALTSE